MCTGGTGGEKDTVYIVDLGWDEKGRLGEGFYARALWGHAGV